MRRLLDHGLILLVALMLLSCGADENPAAPAAGNAHPPRWLNAHPEAYLVDAVRCQVCHAVDFLGQSHVVSCARCHFGGGPPFVKHPPPIVERLSWGHPVNHGVWAEANLFMCQGCHGEPGGPGSNPLFQQPYENMERGCASTEGCHGRPNAPFEPFNNGHNPLVAHPSFNPEAGQDQMNWYGTSILYLDDAGVQREHFIAHINAGNVQQSCTPCHGANLEGGVGPACTACHVVSPVANPSGCTSCHGNLLESPLSYAARVGRNDLDERFLNRVLQDGIHGGIVGIRPQPHGTHALLPPDPAGERCAECHRRGEDEIEDPINDPRTNPNKHHLLDFRDQIIPVGTAAPFGVPGEPYECNSCHSFVLIGGEFTIVPDPHDCASCHSGL